MSRSKSTHPPEAQCNATWSYFDPDQVYFKRRTQLALGSLGRNSVTLRARIRVMWAPGSPLDIRQLPTKPDEGYAPQTMICWTRIVPATAAGARSGRGQSSRPPRGASSRPPSRCRRSPAGRFGRPWRRTRASACAWCRCGSRINGRRWRSCRGRRRPSPVLTRSRRRRDEPRALTAITVSRPRFQVLPLLSMRPLPLRTVANSREDWLMGRW